MAEAGEISYVVKIDTSTMQASVEKANKEINKIGDKTTWQDKLKDGAKDTAKAIGATLVTSAVSAGVALGKMGSDALNAFADFEQLAGGMKKIFDEVDYNTIAKDAQDAYESMNISANQYMEAIAGVGATFAQTMGDQKGYDTAKQGMQALADYASGTGKSVDLLMDKYQAITRSTSGYLSIADQFAGLLPQTTDGFLKQAQASGYLASKYKKLTDVPIDEYQQALTQMLQDGVEGMGLLGNTVAETEGTISGSLNALKAVWQNTLVAFADPEADMAEHFGKLITSIKNVVKNIIPVIGQIIPNIVEAIKAIIPVISEELPNIIRELLPALIEATVVLFEALVEMLPEIIDILVDNADLFVEAIVRIVEVVIQKLPEIMAALGKALLGALKIVVGVVMTAFGDLFTGIGDAIKGFWENELSKDFESFGISIKSFLTNVGKWFADAFNALVPKVKDVFGKIKEVVLNIGLHIGEAVSGAIKGAINTVLNYVEGIINKPIEAINGLIDIINAVPGISLGKLDTISLPRLATGGIVESTKGGSVITAGEAGEDEWVVPESKMASMLEKLEARGLNGNSGNITINVEGVWATNAQQKREVAEDIWGAINQINKSKMGAYL